MKRLLCGLSILVLVLVMMSPAAYAATSDVYVHVSAANNAIEARIERAQEDANRVLAQSALLYKLAFTDRQRDAITKLKDTRIDQIINDLVRSTDRIAANTIETAARSGVTVICSYVEVVVGDRVVLVDPLIVCDE